MYVCKTQSHRNLTSGAQLRRGSREGPGGPDPGPSTKKNEGALLLGNAKLPFGNEMIRYYCQ